MVIEGGGNRGGMGEVVGVKWEVVGDVEGLVRSNSAHFTPTSFSSDSPGDCSASSCSEMSVNRLRTSSLHTEDCGDQPPFRGVVCVCDWHRTAAGPQTMMCHAGE